MCKPASFVVTKNRIFWSKLSNSHEDIIEENNLNDSTRSPDFVRIEISPKDKDLTIPMKNWIFKLDQDFKPEWFDPKEAEIAARLELKSWRKCFIINRKSDKPLIISEGEKYVISGNIIVDGGYVKFYEKSKGTVYGGVADFCNKSTGTVNGGDINFFNYSTGTVNGGRVNFLNKSTGTVNDGTVYFWDNSTGTVNGGFVYFRDKSKRLN